MHKVEALKAGLDPEIVDAIEARAQPVFAQADEELVYDLFTALLETKQVGDEVYARALDIFGEAKLVELIAIFGHYNHVAAILNTFRVPVPPAWPEMASWSGQAVRSTGPARTFVASATSDRARIVCRMRMKLMGWGRGTMLQALI